MFENTKILVKRNTKTHSALAAGSSDLAMYNGQIDKLITEGGEGFYNYVKSIGLVKDPKMIVLSSLHHYFYDAEELNNVKTVINLKELNKIREIRNHLQSNLDSLPPKCNFVGYFVNNTKVGRYSLRVSSTLSGTGKRSDDLDNSIISRFPFINMLYGMLDSKTNTFMSETSVKSLLEDNGFKIIDMTEYNGLTFFHSQKQEAS